MLNIPSALVFALMFWTLITPAHAQGMVTISSPEEGARLSALDDNLITYRVDPGPHGDHVHLYDNGREIAVIRHLIGSYPLSSVGMGAREVCIKVVNRAHVPIGVERCVNIVVE